MVLFGDDSFLHLAAIHLPVRDREKEGPAKSRILKKKRIIQEYSGCRTTVCFYMLVVKDTSFFLKPSRAFQKRLLRRVGIFTTRLSSTHLYL